MRAIERKSSQLLRNADSAAKWTVSIGKMNNWEWHLTSVCPLRACSWPESNHFQRLYFHFLNKQSIKRNHQFHSNHSTNTKPFERIDFKKELERINLSKTKRRRQIRKRINKAIENHLGNLLDINAVRLWCKAFFVARCMDVGSIS